MFLFLLAIVVIGSSLVFISSVATSQTTLSDSTQWRYYVEAAEAPTGWNTNEFDGSSWQTSTLASAPSAQSISAYYCASFDISSVVQYASVDYTITTKGGYALYLNGVEQFRDNLPEGTLTYMTQSLTQSDAAVSYRVSLSFAAAQLSASGNLICLETHTMTTVVDDLTFSLSLLMNEDDLVVDGVLSYSHPGFDDGTWYEAVLNAVNKNTNDKFNSMNSDGSYTPDDDHVWIQWTYNNNRAVFINYLNFYSGNMPNRRPHNVDVLGSNDGETWDTLMHDTPSWSTSQAYGYNKVYTFDNTKSYRMYRVDTYGFDLQGIEMAEVYLGTRATVVMCSATDGYSASYAGTKAVKACDDPTYLGAMYRTCLSTGVLSDEVENTCMAPAPDNLNYGTDNVVTLVLMKDETVTPTYIGYLDTWSISPALPNNLVFDTTTGVISGRLQNEMNEVKFTVTASSSYGSITETITISSVIVNCEATDVYPATNHGEYAITSCPQYYISYGMSQCLGGVFEELDLTHCVVREATIFTYAMSSLSVKIGVTIEPMTLMVDSLFTGFTISPDLPNGLMFSEDGSISGTATEPSTVTVYTISGISAGGNKETTLSIEVIDYSCAALDSFPAAANGATSSSTTECPTYMHGTATRLCTNGVFGPINTSNCVYDDITGFHYTPSTISVTSGEGIVSSDPEYTGYASSFMAVGSLPSGLTLTSTGVIVGVLKETGSFTITVRAINENSQVTTNLVITVSAVSCTGVNGITVANGDRLMVQCPTDMEGEAFRTCTNGVLSSVDVSGCTYMVPSNLTYATTVFVMTTEHSYVIPRPGVEHVVSEFSVEPELPSGLVLETNGRIQGTPTTATATADYVVTARNEKGSCTATLTITVELPKCDAMKDFPATTVGESYTLDCTTIEGYKGTSTRTCVEAGIGLAKWDKPTSFCIESKMDLSFVIGIILIIVGMIIVVLTVISVSKTNNVSPHPVYVYDAASNTWLPLETSNVSYGNTNVVIVDTPSYELTSIR